MRHLRYKNKNDAGAFIYGRIYKSTQEVTDRVFEVNYYANSFPMEWEEVSEEEYLKQEGFLQESAMENKKKLGTEPAFPIEEMQKNIDDTGISQLMPHLGMSKRFYAACMAMQGLLSKHGEYSKSNMLGLTPEEAIRKSFLFSDEILRQEEL